MTSEAQPNRTKHILKKIGRISLRIVLFLILFIVLVLLALQTPPVQNFARKQAQAFLQKKLKTRVEIGRIYIGFPKDIVLASIYLEDRKKDTLLYGGDIRVDLDMWKLLKSDIAIQEIKLESITAKVKRE